MSKKGKGWTRVGQFPSLELAMKRKGTITAKGLDVTIEKGTKGTAWATPHDVYRLWAREKR